MRDKPLVIATRQSNLALWQANFVRGKLRDAHPGLVVDLLGLTTQGDRWLAAPLAELGGKGLFIKELEQALASGRADIAVHSMKDVPAELPGGFAMPVMAFRADPRDVLVSSSGAGLAELPEGARVGSSSLRRQAQLRMARPDLRLLPVRGNVETRLAKLDAGEYDAIVLAAAGLERLALAHRATEYLALDVCLPAAGQGALGIECRADDEPVSALLAPLADREVAACVSAERAVSAALGADCTAPLGAHARLRGPEVHLEALLASADGRRVLRAAQKDSDPVRAGSQVAARLLADGAAELLREG